MAVETRAMYQDRLVLRRLVAPTSLLLLMCVLQSLPLASARAVRLRTVASGLASPVFITHAGDARLFIVEQVGRIRIVQDGTLLDTPFLDISALVKSGGEQGLLSVSFHPD